MVLELLMELQEQEPVGVTELAKSLGVAKSTVHNHLATLEAYEYVVREGDTYRIGIQFLNHGGHARANLLGHELIKRKVQEVAEQTGELVQYLVEEHGRGIFVFRETGDQAVKTQTRIGKRVYLHHVTAGKTALAYMPEERVKEIVDRHGLPPKTQQTITTREELFQDLATIRERGFAFDKGEHVRGLCAIGVPVILDNDELVGTMSIAGPAHRVRNEGGEAEFAQLLRGVANEIKLNLSYDID